MNAFTRRLLLPVCTLVLGGWSAFAQAELVKVSGRVYQEETVVAPDGSRGVRHVPASRLFPGSEVIYEVSYSNVGAKTTSQIIITNPLPSDLSYRSAPGRPAGTSFDVSVDNGGTYGALATLVVGEYGGTKRPARESDITHVRWTINDPVKPGQAGKVTLRAVIR
ncbi:MAG: hypothetical protein ACT4QA_19415 [Panacagrimonas sp.]